MVYLHPAAATDEGDQLSGGSRMCTACDTRKPVEEFHLANGGRHRRRKCKDCTAAMSAVSRAAKPEQYAATARRCYLRRKYDITPEEFDALIIAQTGRCAICSDPLDGVLHIDHDHETNRVRGLLDFNCNTALGKFRDSVPILRAAIAYLER